MVLCNWTLLKLIQKNYHLLGGMLLFRKNVNRSCLIEIKLFLLSLEKMFGKDPNQNDVQIVDRSYLERNFKAQSEAAQNLIEGVVMKFDLNSEQERAFRIVANHAATPGAEQLIMYVGGMGGTGKSQVIKALMDFFKSRNESH